jgi:hypothetical protein
MTGGIKKYYDALEAARRKSKNGRKSGDQAFIEEALGLEPGLKADQVFDRVVAHWRTQKYF